MRECRLESLEVSSSLRSLRSLHAMRAMRAMPALHAMQPGRVVCNDAMTSTIVLGVSPLALGGGDGTLIVVARDDATTMRSPAKPASVSGRAKIIDPVVRMK